MADTEAVQAEAWRSRFVRESVEDAADLVANPDNWRQHPPAQRDALEHVLARIGWVQRVIANDTTGHVIDGHLRVELAAERAEQVPVVWVQLTPEEEAIVLATLDPLAAMATTDTDRLRELVGGVDVDFRDNVAEIVGMRAVSFLATEDDGGDQLEPTGEPVTRPGDVIELGPHRLKCGDTFDADDRASLLDGAKVAAIVTDPPYAIYGSSTGVSSEVSDDKMVRPFFAALFRAALDTVDLFGHIYVFCDWRSWAAVWEGAKQAGAFPRNLLVWDKGSSGLGAHYFNTYELVGFYAKLPKENAMRTNRQAGQRTIHRPNMLRFDRVPGVEREHNAQKPVPLLTEMIENSTDAGGAVADLFGGSGSTLIAAEQLGRRAYVMEIDPGWCDVIVARWEQATGNTATRAARPKRKGK